MKPRLITLIPFFWALFALPAVNAQTPAAGDAVEEALASHPKSDPAELLRGMLRLAADAPQQPELTSDTVYKALGIRLEKWGVLPNRGAFSGRLTAPDWLYSLFWWEDPAHPWERVLQLAFAPAQSGATGTSVCAVDFDAADAALRRAGYEPQAEGAYNDPHSNMGGVSYKRGQIMLEVQYMGESRPNLPHRCIYYFSMTVPNLPGDVADQGKTTP